MKLAQVINLSEQETQTKVMDWIHQHGQNVVGHVTFDENGSVRIMGNMFFDEDYPADFPDIEVVSGDCRIDLHGTNLRLPKLIGGSCEIHLENQQEIHIKASDIPVTKNFNNNAFFLLDGTTGTIELDDITNIQTYQTHRFGFLVTSGLEKLSQLTSEVINIGDNMNGIPDSLSTKLMMFTLTNGQSLKGIHRKLKSLTADLVLIRMGSPGPLLAFVRPSYKFESITLICTGQDQNKMLDLGFHIKEANHDGWDVIEFQEKLIDNGFGEFAKL